MSDVQADVLVRKIDGKDHTLEYVALSDISNAEGTSCSADSEVNQLNLSSIGKYTTDGISGVYEIFNFHNLDN